MKEESPAIIQPVSLAVADQHLDEFYSLGYTVIDGVSQESDLVEIRKRLDEIYITQRKEAEQNNFKLEDINEQDVVRMTFACAAYSLKLVTWPVVIAYIKKL